MQTTGSGSISLCPPDAIWFHVATGSLSGAEAEGHLQHAAECEICSHRLREALALVSEPDPEEESRSVSGLAVSGLTMKERRQIALRLAVSIRRFDARRFGAIAAMLAVGLGGAFWYSQIEAQPPSQALLAAYEARRPFEPRLAGARYSPSRIQMGGADAAAGLMAETSRIDRHLATSPRDTAWMHAKGIAEMLGHRYDPALTAMETAANLGADTPAFWLDFGTLHYLRAEAGMAGGGHEAAERLISRALVQQPRKPEGLFNRALAYERLGKTDQAIRDIEELLRMESDLEWRSEAQSVLNRLRR